MPLNIDYKKEFLITIMGPLFQFIAYFILLKIFNNNYLVKAYHYGILEFNLLPIYPLDGGKLCNIFLNKLIPYKKSLKFIILISYSITIIQLFSSKVITLNVIITYILLIYLIRKEEIKIPFQYNKFLLERYLNNYSFKKIKVITNYNNFYKYRENIIKIGNKLYSEKEYLREKYDNFHKKC